MSSISRMLSHRASSADAHGIRVIQLLIGGTLLIGCVLVMMDSQSEQIELLLIGIAIAFLGTGAAVALPWHRWPLWVTSVIPALDIIAIGVLREASPSAGFALLWAFPAMWAAWTWGIPGAVGSTVVISLLYWIGTAVYAMREFTAAAVLLPLSIAAATALAYLYAQRTAAQRRLLERQSLALRSAVERATREESLLGEVLDAVDFGVAKVSARGEVLLANAASTAFMRLRRDAGDAVYAADGLTRIDPEASPNLRARRGELFEGELAWFGAAGEDRRALRTTSRVLTAGEAGERLIITTDVTEEQLALRSRNDLVSSVSHELRTPLTSILGYLELAIDNPALPDAVRPNLQIAERNAERLLELVTNILTAPAYTRSGVEIRLDPRPFEMSSLVRECLVDLESRVAAAGLTLDLTGVEEAPVYGDPKRIAQVIENLVSNAIKYNREHGRIDIGVRRDGAHTWVVVRDTGQGIAKGELGQVFDRFFRSDAVRNTSTHGHGLGLAISRDIVRAHGGEITVQSTPGEGTTFIVRLPAQDPKAARS